MKSAPFGKFLLILAVVVIFLYGILGIPGGLSAHALRQALLHRIHLGLDLKGGTHLIMQVQVNEAVRAETRQRIEDLKAALRKHHLTFAHITQPDPTTNPDQVVISNVPLEQSPDLGDIVARTMPDYAMTSTNQNHWILNMKPASLSRLKKQTVTQSIETIRNRIDQLGVTEPVIEPYGMGHYEILVELPGVSNPARVENIMRSTAMLDVRQAFGSPYPSRQSALAANHGILPQDTELLPGPELETSGSPSGTAYYLVSRVPAITGRDLRAGGASVSLDENNRPDVDFLLTNEGGQKFANFTGSHIGDQLAVVLDNKVMEIATIQQQITEQGRITGDFTNQSAKDLALVLNSGALPASIRYIEESTVGPSLGADSIREGVESAVIAMAAVLIFMLIYYRGAGINADVALILNLLILLGFLGFSGATLTLPGIAGAILTVGMGVDSNVLIFERIREEVRNGKTPSAAVDQGFAHAWITIVDTHVTTIVSAAILFLFGTGPIKGFAVTLTFGLLANLFTSVFVSRAIFEFILEHKARRAALSI